MSREIARALIQAKLNELRKLTYADLLKLVDEVSAQAVNGPDGEEYQMEIEARWDSPRQHRDIRVMVAVDGGGVSAFKPMHGDFIMAPDGSFVGDV